MKQFWLLFLCVRSLQALTASGGVWSDPQSFPGESSNTVFPAYDSNQGVVVVSWIDAVNFPMGSEKGFSSSFNGSTWTAPLSLPVNGAASPVAPITYNTSLGKAMVTWSDAAQNVYSSTLTGEVWEAAQAVPGGMAFIPFITYDSEINKSAVVWTNTMQSYSSLYDGTSWSAVPQMQPATGAFLVFASGASGQLISTWVDTMMGGNVYVSTFDGSNWSAPLQLATNANAPTATPIISMPTQGLGQTVVTWSDMSTGQGFSSSFDGSTWGAPIPIPHSTLFPGPPVFTVYNPSIQRLMGIWTDAVMMGTVYSEFDGTVWTEPQMLPGLSPNTFYVAIFDPTLGKVLGLGFDGNTHTHFYSIFSVQFVPPPGTFQSKNAQNVANYLNTAGQAAALQPILGTLNNLSPSEQNAAVESISNSRNASISWEAASAALSFSQALANHGATLRNLAQVDNVANQETASLSQVKEKDFVYACAPCKKRCDTKLYGLWVEGLGSWGYQKAESGNPAFNAMTGAAFLGFDYYGERLKMVTSLIYGRSHIDQKQDAGSGNINSYAVSLLGTGSIRHVFVEGGVTGVYNQNQSKRHVVFPGFDAVARASFHSWQVVPHLALGYDIERGNWTCEPFISGDCAILFQEGFAETGAAPLNMAQPASTSYLFEGRGGVRAYYTRLVSSGVWFLKFSGAYQYKKSWGVGEIANAFIVGQPAGFTVISLDKPQNGFVPALEFFYRGNNGFFTSLAYEGEFAKQAFLNTAMLKLGYAW